MAMLEQVKSSLQSLSNNIWATIAKVVLIALFAFCAYIFIKYFRVFASTVTDAVEEVGRELDAVQVGAAMSDTTPSYVRTFLMVLLTIGKVLIVTSTIFASFMLIEAHALLPATVLCFIYGTLIGALFGYYHAKGRWPWNRWFRCGGQRLRGGERVYLERCVEERHFAV